MSKKISNYINIIRCPECHSKVFLKENCLVCFSCKSSFKIHRNSIIKLFSKENIYPTRKKIKWGNKE